MWCVESRIELVLQEWVWLEVWWKECSHPPLQRLIFFSFCSGIEVKFDVKVLVSEHVLVLFVYQQMFGEVKME